MWNTALLLSIILGLAGQSVWNKSYTNRFTSKGTYLFCAMGSLSVLLFFVICGGLPEWEPGIFGYSLAFAIAYAAAMIGTLQAIGCGSLSLSSLAVSYSLMIPTLYGLIVLHDPMRPGFVPGLALLLVSLVLINKKDPYARISLKWILYISLAFLGNGACTVVQKMQQIAFQGAYKNELMIGAMAVATVVLLVPVLIRERKDLRACAAGAAFRALPWGVCNGAVNLCVMVLSGRMPISLMFPLISAGSIVVTFLVARLFYRERLAGTQYIGLLLGIAAVVFLNL